MVLVTQATVGGGFRTDVVHTEPLVWEGREGGIASRRSPLPVAFDNQGCAWRSAALNALDHAVLFDPLFAS